MRRETKKRLSDSAASGIVALIFLVLGFQLAVFVMKVVRRPASVDGLQEESVVVAGAGSLASGDVPVVGSDSVPPAVNALRGYPRPQRSGLPARGVARGGRRVESFPFDPNTVTLEELVRLGLSERQAESVDNYRKKGGRFREKQDFAKMYVVSDTLFRRLEPFIEIAKVELNGADSAALVSLSGIGPYFAGRIISYRRRAGGFWSVEQLLEIDRFDREKLEHLRPQVVIDTGKIEWLDLWNEEQERLSLHPYLGERAAKAIQRFKKVYDTAAWSVENLLRENILSEEEVSKLRHYLKR